MPRVGFTFDASSFTQKLGDYARSVQNSKPKAQIIREQLRFAFKALDGLTPFSTLAEGREVVHRDLLRALKPYGGEDGSFSKIKNEALRDRMRTYSRDKEYGKLKDVFDHLNAKGGFYSGWEWVDFSPEMHHRFQSRRGRVDRDHQVVTPQVQEWRDYLKLLQGQVGRARGGWVPSGQALGISYPQWISRWSSGGSVSASIQPNKIRFDFVNRAIFIPDYRRQVETAFAGRERAMANDLRRMFEGFATHAGFGR